MKKLLVTLFLLVLLLTPLILANSSNKPKVELFVMSKCPFALQSEKGLIPVLELFEDKIDFKLRFVSYAMHGKEEIDENTVQYCIQKEQPEKLYDYLKCYLEDQNPNYWGYCRSQVGINKTVLDSCIEETDLEFKITELYNNESSWQGGRFPPYNIDSGLNNQYNIRGSPTLVINGVISSAGRDSASYLEEICEAFSQPPEECDQVLSSESPSPGFDDNTNTEETPPSSSSSSTGGGDDGVGGSSGSGGSSSSSGGGGWGCTSECKHNDSCIPFGYRLIVDDENVYCDISHELELQKPDNSSCQNSFECLSGQCTNGVCINLQEEVANVGSKVEEGNSILEEIIGFLKKLFWWRD
jgi:uncharacterized membrane protein YgcG